MKEIGGLFGNVAKLDFQTDNGSRGKFARMAVYIDLEKPFVSQNLVNGMVQRVEFELLPTIYFSCGQFGHIQDLCTIFGSVTGCGVRKDTTSVALLKKEKIVEPMKSFGP